MAFLIDLHVHTARHSVCSVLDPERLIAQAVRAGLDGVVLTEHHYQWPPEELQELVAASGEPGFTLLAGFEYSSAQGDILVYGLSCDEAARFTPGLPPEEAAAQARRLGAACIAAHPTRYGMGFDERIFSIPFDGVEVQSMNMKEHEQQLARHLIGQTGLRPVAASDAHQLNSLGRYRTEFLDPVRTMQDLHRALKSGRFRPAGAPCIETRVREHGE